jgi:hypothetical protein
MSCIPGIEVKLYVDGSEAAIGGALRMESDSYPVDITTLADTARQFTPGKSSWKIHFAGIASSPDVMINSLITASLTRSFVIVRMQINGKLFGGMSCINSITVSADNGKAVAIEAILQGAGEMEK